MTRSTNFIRSGSLTPCLSSSLQTSSSGKENSSSAFTSALYSFIPRLPQRPLQIFVVQFGESVGDRGLGDQRIAVGAFNLDLLGVGVPVESVEPHVIFLAGVHEQVQPLQQDIVMGGEDHLLAIASQRQQNLHQLLHQPRVEVRFRLIPEKNA